MDNLTFWGFIWQYLKTDYSFWIIGTFAVLGLALYVSAVACAMWNKDDNGEEK